MTITSCQDLLRLSPEELEKVDLATINLMYATGLPGSETLDIAAVSKKLDDWVAQIKSETTKYYPRFLSNPSIHNNSEADYRMLMLITVLQLDLGVHYNMKRVNDPDFRNSKDLFIHGMIGEDNGGTCISMPICSVSGEVRLSALLA